MAAKALLLVLSFFLQDNAECLNQCVSRYSPYFRGYYTKALDCPGATLRNQTFADENIVCCIFDTAVVPSIPLHISVSREAYLNMVGDTTRTRALYPFYMQALSTAGITGKQEIAAFTAQILYQTSGMIFSEENSNGEKYKGVESLGNFANGGTADQETDNARKFISRGFLPLIGQHMYGLVSSSVNNKIIRQPEMVAFPSTGFQVAAWLWRNGYSSADDSSLPTENLGIYYNGTEYSFVQLSYKIQNSTTGIEKLFQYWRHTVKVIGLPCPSQGEGPACSSGKKEGRCKLVTSCKGEYSSAGGCPGPLPITCCLDCQNPIDLAFVLDSSGSVTVDNFRLGLDFIIRVCEYFDIGYPHGTRVALIRYSDVASIMFSFNTYINKQDVLDAIRAISYQAGTTHTDLALLMAHTELFVNATNGVRRLELGVPRVLVLLTDGKSTTGANSLIETSTLLRQEGVNIFVMGIGQSINKNELNIIASDPDADHVVSPKTFAEVNTMVERMREASCYEPALLEEENEVMSSVQQNTVKYYKYDLQNKTGIKTVFMETTSGRGDVSVSMKDKNPRNYPFNLGFCGSQEGNKITTSGRVVSLEELENSSFCSVHEDGGWTDPRSVSNEEFSGKGIVIYVRKCSTGRWFYVSIEGINRTNTFNLTLFNDFIKITENIENIDEKSENKTATFPIPENVYIGVAMATIGTTLTVASVVALSCAKEFKIKGSTKIKKKKRAKHKTEAKNSNAAINKGFEGDNDVRLVSFKNRTIVAPLVAKYEHISTGGPSRNATGREKELQEKDKVRSICVTEMETKNINQSRTSSSSAENRRRKSSTETTTLANTSQNKHSSPSHEVSLVSSMIHDLQREETFIQETATSERNSCVEKSRFQRQITSTSVSVSVVSPPQTSKTSQLVGNESEKKTSCCFQWKPTFSSNKVEKSKKTEEDPKNIDIEKNGTEVENDEKAEKVTFLQRIRRKLTWRNVLVVLCPCFTYYILGKENVKKKTLDNGKEGSAKGHCEIRDRRFERDMQISQAFCVLLSQLLFVVGADARNNKNACAFVAIVMNYLSLVTLCWLVVQALYLFSFARRRESEAKQKLKINLYYAGAWGSPLVAVMILASKYDSYNKHPHCWISFSDAVSWSVATPLITLGLVQVVLVILLVKALVTYRKSGNVDENRDRKNIIKSGLITVVCITITVIVTWLLGSLSLNIDKDVYHMFFTVFNALQGFAFFLFYVVLNPEIRQLLLAAWKWKQSSETPFDEHEAIEIEDDKKKDKKKGKGKSKATNNNTTRDKTERKAEEQCNVETVQNVAGARMAAASIVNNSKVKNKENATLVKFGHKKEARKTSLDNKPSGNVADKKLPPIAQKKKKTPSNQAREPRRKIEVQEPRTVKEPAGKTKDFPPSSQDKGPPSTSPGDFSSLPLHGVCPRSPTRKLQPITTAPSQSPRLEAKNEKQRGKKKASKGKKT